MTFNKAIKSFDVLEDLSNGLSGILITSKSEIPTRCESRLKLKL